MRIKDIKIKIKDFLLRQTLLLKNRDMFYIEEIGNFSDKTFQVKEPISIYKNMTHREWFRNINLNINSVTRGYYYNGIVKIYERYNHEMPAENVLEKVLSVYSYFVIKGEIIEEIHLGGIPNIFKTIFGINWSTYAKVDLNELKQRKLLLEWNTNFKKLR